MLATTAKNSLISPNLLMWKLGEITVFFAVYDACSYIFSILESLEIR